MWATRTTLRLKYSELAHDNTIVLTQVCLTSKSLLFSLQCCAPHCSLLWLNAFLEESEIGFALLCLDVPFFLSHTFFGWWDFSHSDLMPWLCCYHVSHGPAESPRSLFWFQQAWARYLSPVSMWYSDNITSTGLLGNAIVIIACGARVLSPPSRTHLSLPSVQDASGTLILPYWDAPLHSGLQIVELGFL